MKSKYILSGIAILTLSAAPMALAQQTVGQGTKEGAKSVGQGTAKGANKLGRETKEGAREFSDKTSESGQDIKKGHVVEAGKDFGQGAGKLGAKTGKGLGGFFSNMGSGIGHGAKSFARGVKSIFD
jgi:hypothetical protein